MAGGGIRDTLARLNAVVRSAEAALTPAESTEYGGWKRLGMALGHFGDIVRQNEADGYFTVGLLATCPSMPGLVAGLQKSGSGRDPLRIGMLWLDAHPDINTPETTAADHSAACRWPWRPAAPCNACGSTPVSSPRCPTSTWSWAVFA
jgi:arginase family enzyme